MKYKSAVVATLVAASFGTSLLVGLLGSSSALADRPGYRPSGSSGSSSGSGNGAVVDPGGSLAKLTGADPEERIYVYPSPSTEVDPIGYGFAGDEVRVFDSVEGYVYVQFERSGARGWVDDGFIGPR